MWFQTSGGCTPEYTCTSGETAAPTGADDLDAPMGDVQRGITAVLGQRPYRVGDRQMLVKPTRCSEMVVPVPAFRAQTVVEACLRRMRSSAGFR